ncbi:MAG: hypothetical protein EON57_06615 [Alphaproteobacteria bacterium]|nr:MAG: hypothetical protein EON57_06615 [Alphaproteobacteria bacterium]
MGLAIQLAGSLVAILVLAWLAHRLGLGGDARIRSEDEARALADEALHGFEPTEIAIDKAGMGALCRDGEGRVLLLRRHGSHWASRLLDSHSHTRLDQGFLTLATADRRFGSITFDLGDKAPMWAASLRRITS